MVIPYVIYGPPYYILRHLVARGFSTAISSETLRILPRLIICVLGISVDFLIFRLCRILELDPRACLMLLASSHVTLVFHCRTFSNTIESYLFAVLMYLVVSSVVESGGQQKQTTTQTDLEGNHNSVFIVIVIVMGFLNRPTFLLFAVVPYLYWVLDGGAPFFSPLKDYGLIAKRIVSSTLTAIFTGIAFIICDSFYYGSLSTQYLWNAIFATKLNLYSIVNILEKLTVTPPNFITYDLKYNQIWKQKWRNLLG